MTSIVPINSKAASTSGRYSPVAGPVHTIVVLAAIGAWTFGSKLSGRPLIMGLSSHPVRLYVLTALAEWIMFTLVVVGVRLGGTSISAVLGDRWHSRRQILRDVGIAAAFWIIAAVLLWLLSLVWRFTPNSNVLSILPHGIIQVIAWIGLSVSAGICEETIFRGYLQQQFIAVTKSVPAGILLSAAVFGIGHAYEGLRMILPVGLYGVMFGVLSYWRRSVRPGMIAHAWHDALIGIVVSFLRH
jgi:membrane protease YdiL (CAAX protease family)